MKYAVILAGGTGSRAGGRVPKQFHEIAGRPLLWWSLRAFHEADPDARFIIVVHPDWSEYWSRLMEALPARERFDYVAVCGGRDRVESVANALDILRGLQPQDGEALVAVHDGARCCVTPGLIRRGWETASKYGAAVPAVAVTDSLRRLVPGRDGEPGGSHSVDRAEYVAVQTPQVFGLPLLLECFDKRVAGHIYTDDASIVEPHHPITLYPGEYSNIKVTNPGDFAVAEAFHAVAPQN
ncbi:MAG: 2-C-methyl-D-erythritol 4-phosphate cytidylyltransferase [Muribaculaceae bacterium]|nr:2-C-methyl-D-erythritol 4-phosphate cytidylyltransferase [Muribaculaceae bacterium]